ncbi:MAG: nucleotidyl transferase AbiEii/AbiGii toxin family protein [Actinomycetota bacterium]
MVREPAATLVTSTALTARERWLHSSGGPNLTDQPPQLAALQVAVAALGAGGVRCALIGGLAVGVRSGVARATMDVDLAVPTRIPRARLVEVMQAAGFELRGDYPHSINFVHSSGEPVQLAIDPGFDAVVDQAELISVNDLQVPVARREDLIEMKARAAADPARRRSKALRDLADLELLASDVPDADEGW